MKKFACPYCKKFFLGLLITVSAGAVVYVSAIFLEMTTGRYARATRVDKMEKALLLNSNNLHHMTLDIAEIKTIVKEIRDKK